MAVNPMQRRARQSFLIGFLLALLIMAVVVFLLIKQIKTIEQAKAALEAKQSQCLVAKSNLESGQEVTMDDFITETVQTTMSKESVINSSDFDFVDEKGNPVDRKVTMRISVPRGTIVTKNMVQDEDNKLDDTERIREFSMISLPSQLKNGDYIDIRLSIPNGQDYIVLSKKQVLGCSATTVWLRLNELELELMNSAIVENYTMTGSRLYALEYIEAGMQEQSVPNYVASQDIISLMEKNPNIKKNLLDGYYDKIYDIIESRTIYIQPEVEKNIDNQANLVNSGNAAEQETIKAARKAYVDSLEGSGDIGYTEDNN